MGLARAPLLPLKKKKYTIGSGVFNLKNIVCIGGNIYDTENLMYFVHKQNTYRQCIGLYLFIHFINTVRDLCR